MFDIKKLYPAASVYDALCALQKDPDSQLIAGGTDVLIRVREGKLSGASLVSIHGLPELTGVQKEADGTIVIGPCTPFAAIAANDIIQTELPALGEAVDQVGGPQTREVATIGGNLCNGATSADSAPMLLTLNAELVLQGPEGTRTVPVTEFHTGPGCTVRRRDEILTQLRISPENYAGFGGHYTKYGKRAAMEIATLGCAALIKLEADHKTVSTLRLSYGVAAPTPIRCPEAEALAKGQILDDALLDAIARAAAAQASPRSSWRASREFRLQLIKELARRTIRAAAEKARGGCSYA